MSDKKKFINWLFVHEVRLLRSVNGFRNQLPEIGRKLGQNQDEYNFLSTVVVVNLLIHARNLREFFYASGDSRTAYAKDYVDWKTPPKTENIKELEARINHEIMHMDWESVDKYDLAKSWKDLDGVVKDLQVVAKKFLSELDRQHPDYFEVNLKNLKATLDKEMAD